MMRQPGGSERQELEWWIAERQRTLAYLERSWREATGLLRRREEQIEVLKATLEQYRDQLAISQEHDFADRGILEEQVGALEYDLEQAIAQLVAVVACCGRLGYEFDAQEAKLGLGRQPQPHESP